MKILAFDTCFGACSVAVGVDGRVVHRAERLQAGHAERLMPMVVEVMDEAGIAMADLSLIAVTRGPGTFTGLRVGVAAARALALATGVPVVATTSLHVMAAGALNAVGVSDRARELAVAVATRDGYLYLQLFDGSHAMPLADAILTTPAVAADLVSGRAMTIVGSGRAALFDAIAELGRPMTAERFDDDIEPDARDLLALAPRLAKVAPVVPLYLRAPDAKPQTGKALPHA